MNAAPAPLSFEEVPLSPRHERPLTLEVPEHETIAVLGDLDSGVNALGGYTLGLEDPPGGRIWVFGTILQDMPEHDRLAFRRRVGYLPAGDALLQNLSLRDNVALPLRFGSGLPGREIDGRVNIMLAAVRITELADLRPAQVNEEGRRRAGFARAMAFDPPLLILERPFNGITARAAAELLEIARGGETATGARRTIFVTGQELPPLLLRRADRVYRLSRTGALELETA